jgi:hypothetical protein
MLEESACVVGVDLIQEALHVRPDRFACGMLGQAHQLLEF